MLKKEDVSTIKQLLLSNEYTLEEIAIQVGVSKTTVANINSGKAYRDKSLEYPLKLKKGAFTKNEVGFCAHLHRLGYTIKQINIILSKGSYTTISNNVYSNAEYITEETLEERKRIFDIISKPNEKLINKVTYNLTLDDFIYIKFLARMGAEIEDIYTIYLPFIASSTEFSAFPIDSIEKVRQYCEWGGKNNKIIYWIQQIYYNRVSSCENIKFYYDDINVDKLLLLDNTMSPQIIKEMITVKTKENFTKRGETQNETKEDFSQFETKTRP